MLWVWGSTRPMPNYRRDSRRRAAAGTRRADKIVAALDDLGITGSAAGVREFAANADMISRTHFARFLVKLGHVKDMQSAFRRYLGAGQPGFVPHQSGRASATR